jgi:hypothetical protein
MSASPVLRRNRRVCFCLVHSEAPTAGCLSRKDSLAPGFHPLHRARLRARKPPTQLPHRHRTADRRTPPVNTSGRTQVDEHPGCLSRGRPGRPAHGQRWEPRPVPPGPSRQREHLPGSQRHHRAVSRPAQPRAAAGPGLSYVRRRWDRSGANGNQPGLRMQHRHRRVLDLDGTRRTHHRGCSPGTHLNRSWTSPATDPKGPSPSTLPDCGRTRPRNYSDGPLATTLRFSTNRRLRLLVSNSQGDRGRDARTDCEGARRRRWLSDSGSTGVSKI